MAVTRLPVGTEPGQDQAERFGGQIGDGLVGPKQEAGVADDEREAAAALLVGPADPLVARAQTAGGGAKDQHVKPVAVRVDERVMETLTDGLEAAQIMMRVEQLLGARQFVRFQELDLQAVQELLLFVRGQGRA